MLLEKLAELVNVVLDVTIILQFAVDTLYAAGPLAVPLALVGKAADAAGSERPRIITGRPNSSTSAADIALTQKHKGEMDKQEEFAKYGIRWKVNDAIMAGISPLAALGAHTNAYQPVSTSSSGGSSPSAHLSDLGQSFSRAAQAALNKDEREKIAIRDALALENQQLQNELLRSQITSINKPINPPLPSNSNMPLLTGQGNAYVHERPLQTIHTQPNNPAQEVGKISDYGFVQTPTGLAVVPSKDVKEKIEDQIVPEAMWAIRNQLMPNFGMGPQPPDPKYYPLPAGHDRWVWNPRAQEFQPMKKGHVRRWEKWFK